MKRIHFNYLGNDNSWILLITLSLVFIGTGIIEPFEFENQKIYKYLSSCGFLLQSIYFSKLFWFKNTIQWNDKGIVIRIKSLIGKSFRFDEIKATELNEKTLSLTKNTGEKITFNLNEFLNDDIQILNEIISKNTTTNNI